MADVDTPVGAGEVSASPAKKGAGYGVAVMLAVVYTFNYMDRQFLTTLAQPVKLDLHLSDTQLGLLTGLAFAVFYTFFGIPVAALADRSNRVRIIAVACALWSLFSAACGLATNFVTLAAARIGVGVGEAGGSAPSYALISDYFPPERRGAALAIYSLGVPIGSMAGAASGGFLASRFGWRAAFIIVGGLGLLVAPALLMLVKEPPRGRFDAPSVVAAKDAARPIGMIATLVLFLKTPKLLFTALSAGLTAFVGYGASAFVPSWLIREHGMSLNEIAIYYSLAIGISGAAGTYLSGALVDLLGPKRPAAYALVPGVTLLVVGLPFFFVQLHVAAWAWALAALVVYNIAYMFYLAPGLAIVQNAVRPERRGVAGALHLFLLNLIGLGGGPVFVGMMSDHAKAAGARHSLTDGLSALYPVFILAFLCQLAAAVFIHRDRRTGL